MTDLGSGTTACGGTHARCVPMLRRPSSPLFFAFAHSFPVSDLALSPPPLSGCVVLCTSLLSVPCLSFLTSHVAILAVRIRCTYISHISHIVGSWPRFTYINASAADFFCSCILLSPLYVARRVCITNMLTLCRARSPPPLPTPFPDSRTLFSPAPSPAARSAASPPSITPPHRSCGTVPPPPPLLPPTPADPLERVAVTIRFTRRGVFLPTYRHRLAKEGPLVARLVRSFFLCWVFVYTRYSTIQ